MSVLIVDNNRVLRRFHANLFRRPGLEVKVVANGRDAFDLICSGEQFDLILIDDELPVLDGIETTVLLRAIGVDSMIVGLTNYLFEREVFLGIGATYCHRKPLTRRFVTFLLRELYG